MSEHYLVLTNCSAGLYNFRRDLLRKMCSCAKVSVSAPSGEYNQKLETIGCRVFPTEIQRRSMNPIADLAVVRKYWSLLTKEKPDMVITYTIKPNIYGGVVCRLRRVPYAVNITGLGTAFQTKGLMRRLMIQMYRTALKKAKVVFFENAGNMQFFIKQKIVRPQQCCLLNGAGVNLERFGFAEYPRNDQPRFLFMGRIMREKGIEELLEAMELLHKDGENCCLDVLGDFEEDYSEKFERGRQQGWLHYYGAQSDVRPYIEKAHCFVLPSYHEGMANTNLECAAMGRPLITSDIPGCREAVVENVSGLLCQPRNANSLYCTMKRFLQLTYEQRQAMGKAGRSHMEQVFDRRVVVQKTMDSL